jgi:hypothetical protein
MNQLRRVLYLDAALWAVAGLALVAVPRLLLVNLARLPLYPEYVWVRATGVVTLSLAMLMVLVAQNAEQTWFWTWAFIFAEGSLTILFGLRAAFSHGGAAFWWISAAACAALAAALLWGIAQAFGEIEGNSP